MNKIFLLNDFITNGFKIEYVDIIYLVSIFPYFQTACSLHLIWARNSILYRKGSFRLGPKDRTVNSFPPSLLSLFPYQ